MPRPFLKTRAKETRSTARPRQVQGQVDVPFMLLTVLLVVIGLIMLLSASYPSAYYDLKGNTGGDPFYYFKRQAVYALLGFGIMYLVSRLNYQGLRGLAVTILVVACLLALGVVVGIVRAIGHDYFGSDPNVIALNVGWGIYSLIFLLAAIAVARETRQVRKTIRIDVDIPVVIHYASGIVSRSHTADLSMGGCRVVAPDNRHLEDDIEEIELILQSGAISIPAQLVTSDERFLRLKFDEDIPLSRRRELVRVVLARADAWINPPRPQDNPFRSFFTILRCVFELFWLTWKTRRSQRNRATVAKTAQEDGTL